MSGGAVVHSFSEIFRKIQPYPKDFQSRSAERENPRNMKPHQLLAIIFIAVCSIGIAAAERFAVKNTNATGLDSLDQAIVDANAHPNTDVNTPDDITFDIPASDPNRDPATGVFTITLAFPGLTGVTDPVVIDGYTQDGATPNTLALGNDAVLLVELNGVDASFSGLEFKTGGAGSTVRGLVINRCSTGVFLEVGNIKVIGNFLGTNPAGGLALGNGSGVVASGDGGNQIGTPLPADRNLISGNGNGLVLTNRGAETNTVQNNYIGVKTAGNAALPNSNNGILLGSVAAGAITGETVIGGATASLGTGEGNVISGNAVSGISFNAGGSSTMGPITIIGNIIGLGAAGLSAIGNGGSGIDDQTDPTSTIGAVLIRQNIISGNGGDGIVYASTNTVVQGNLIGTDITGTLDRGNAFLGIEIAGDHRDALDPMSTAMTIGGAAAGDGNIISGNDAGGISIRNANAVIQGNLIGTQSDGTSALGNGADGIRVFNVLADPLLSIAVGGIAPGTSNTIAFNGAAGVHVETSTVAIVRNSIFKNGSSDPGSQSGLGIDLGSGPGVTANDPGDTDIGPNGLQNFPVLMSAKVSASNDQVNITGSLDSRPSTTYELEFFGNDALDPSDFGEGRYFLGATNVTTDATGHVSFETVGFPLVAGAFRVTATATDPLGNTSEFSTSIGQLLNVSTRLRVQTGDKVLIGGFILSGPEPKRILLRGIGASLGAMGLMGTLVDPILELHDGTGKTMTTNDNWKSDQQAEIEETMLQPTDDLESAIIATLPADGAGYTAILRGKNDTSGIALVEAYDLDEAANSKLANISTRGFVETADNVMIGGFILGGGSGDVLVRAIGPALTSLGVTGALQDPFLELHDSFGMTAATNDNWKSTQKAEIEATGLQPSNDAESAILTTLLPGPYTAVVRGQNDTTGVALVEVYHLD
jgi:hypothetical protein